MFNLWGWEEEGGAATELMLSRQSMCLKSWKNQAGTRKWLSQAVKTKLFPRGFEWNSAMPGWGG